MRAKKLTDLLKAGDRVAVSNITGREASVVTAASQRYCGNIVAGWALGKGGQCIEVPGREPINVFATAQEMFQKLPSPPEGGLRFILGNKPDLLLQAFDRQRGPDRLHPPGWGSRRMAGGPV